MLLFWVGACSGLAATVLMMITVKPKKPAHPPDLILDAFLRLEKAYGFRRYHTEHDRREALEAFTRNYHQWVDLGKTEFVLRRDVVAAIEAVADAWDGDGRTRTGEELRGVAKKVGKGEV